MSKLQRLKTRNQFQAVLSGSVLARTPHFAWHCASVEALSACPDPASLPGPTNHLLFPVRDMWFGAMVPKRWAKRAVTRNAIKRQIYSMSSDFGFRQELAAHLVRLRVGFDRNAFPSASSDALMALVRLELHQLFERAIATAGTAYSRLGGV